MLCRISVTERGLTGIANISRSRLSRLDDLLGAGTVPLTDFQNLNGSFKFNFMLHSSAVAKDAVGFFYVALSAVY